MKTVTVKFVVGERVKILDLENARSRVTQICVGQNSTTYEAAWFHNGERKVSWFQAHEIESLEPARSA